MIQPRNAAEAEKEGHELSSLARKASNPIHCPECSRQIFGIGCKTEVWNADEVMFKLGMSCDCGFSIWNDDWHKSFEEALDSIREETEHVALQIDQA